MSKRANPARGEVALEIGGHSFVLAAELERLASLMAESGIGELPALIEAFAFAGGDKGLKQAPHPKLVMTALQTLCVSGNEAELKGAVVGLSGMLEAVPAIVAALLGDRAALDDDEANPTPGPAGSPSSESPGPAGKDWPTAGSAGRRKSSGARR